MKFELCDNDSETFIDVVTDGDELVVGFWGFAFEEAKGWFNSKPVMESLEIWHSGMSDFEMAFKSIKKMGVTK